MDPELNEFLRGLSDASDGANASVESLLALSSTDAPTAVWSSQVLAAQSKVSDRLAGVRTFMFDLESYVEEADR